MGNIANEAEIRKLITAQMAEGIKGSSTKGFEVIHKPLLDISKHNQIGNTKLDELNKSILKLTKMFPDALKNQNDDMIKAQKKLADDQAYNDTKNDQTSKLVEAGIAKLSDVFTGVGDKMTVGLAKLGDELSQIGKGFSNFLAPLGALVSTLGLIGGALSLFSDNENIKNFGLKTVAKAGARTVGKAVSKVGLKAMDWVGGKIASHKAAKAAGNIAGDVAEKAPSKLAKVASITGKVASKGATTALKAIPFIGTAIGLKFAFDKWRKNDKIGAALEIAGAAVDFIPGIGQILSLGIDLISLGRDIKNEADGKFQDPPPPLFTPKTIEVMKNLPVIGGILHMKDAFDYWKAGDKSQALKSMGRGLVGFTPIASFVGIADEIMTRTAGSEDPEQMKESKANNWSALLHTMPGIGVIMNMKDAIDNWKAGDKSGALKSFAKGFVMLNPFGQIFTVAAAVFEKFTGRDMMGELGQTIKGVDTGLSDQLMGKITGILDKVFNFFSKIGEGVAKVAGAIKDFVTGGTPNPSDEIDGTVNRGSKDPNRNGTKLQRTQGFDPSWNPEVGKRDWNPNMKVVNSTYKEAVGKAESGGKYDIGFNEYGYLGKYQIGEPAYTQIKGDKWFGYSWSDFKKNPSLFTPDMQEFAKDLYDKENERLVKDAIIKYNKGKNKKDQLSTDLNSYAKTKGTKGQLMAGAQLGAGNLVKYLSGDNSFTDALGTSVGSYIKKFDSKVSMDGSMIDVVDPVGYTKVAPQSIVSRQPDVITDTANAPTAPIPGLKSTQAQPDAIQTMALDSATIESIGKVMARSMLEIIKSEPDKYAGFTIAARA